MKLRNYLRIIFIFSIFISLNLGYLNAQSTSRNLEHYTGIKNTGNNMTIGIPEYAWKSMPSIGDEIGAFNSNGRLIGAAVFIGGNSALSIWGDDETTTNKDGLESGRRFELRVWNKSNNTEELIVVTSWLEGNDIYKVDGISVINELNIKSLSIADGVNMLGQNTPNPANTTTKINYSIVSSTYVKMVLFSSDGKLIKEFLSENMEAGQHDVDLNVSDLAAGNYYYKLITPDFTDTKYLNIIR